MTKTLTWAILCVMAEGLATAGANASPSLGTPTAKIRDYRHKDPGGDAPQRTTGLNRRDHGAPPPWAPIDLAATTASPTRIDLEWTNVSTRETGIKVERATSPTGPFAPIAILAAGTSRYSDAGLAPHTAYYYRLSAYNASGDSGCSNIVSATPQSTEEEGSGRDHHHKDEEVERREEHDRRSEENNIHFS